MMNEHMGHFADGAGKTDSLRGKKLIGSLPHIIYNNEHLMD